MKKIEMTFSEQVDLSKRQRSMSCADMQIDKELYDRIVKKFGTKRISTIKSFDANSGYLTEIKMWSHKKRDLGTDEIRIVRFGSILRKTTLHSNNTIKDEWYAI